MSGLSEQHVSVFEARANKLDAIRQQGIAFPNQFKPNHDAEMLVKRFGHLDKQALVEAAHKVSCAGRIVRRRGVFILVQDVAGQFQAYFSKEHSAWLVDIDIGDIVGLSGLVQRSNKGDLYVDIHDFHLLTKSLRPLPDKFHGLKDIETRYRERHVDLIMNSESRRVFEVRSKVITKIRQFFIEREYLEVETPMLHPIPGGANAKPFITHHNALDQQMFLRIAPELYLKRLVVGGFDRVFEINRNFRNEGVSARHNPEFTMIEFYQSYATYEDLMDITEALFRYVCSEVLDSLTIVSGGEAYDFSQPFMRLSMVDAILTFNDDIDAADINDISRLKQHCLQKGIAINESWGLGKYQAELFEETVETQLIQPTFITQYPTEISPLARVNDDDPHVTDRFELFVGGREIANGFSELNDAQDQAARFQQQADSRADGDDEAMYFDHDYVRALEYGMPPTAGEGIGIDRLVMLLTDSASIRDVIFFPHMKSNTQSK